MTDRLTPGQLRDLSDLCALGNRVVTLTANGETTRFYPNKDLAYVLREEAARREAEAKPKRHCYEHLHGALCVRDCGDGPCLLFSKREGPGSAAAYYTDTFVCPPDTNADHWAWFLSERSPEYAAVRICEMIERSNESRRALREELAKALANAKPAPAADELLNALRQNVGSQYQKLHDLAADRIIAAEARVRELEAELAAERDSRQIAQDTCDMQKARANRLAAAIDTINVFARAYGRNLHEIVEEIRQTIDALASEGGDRG